jgi:hypothetical protein
LRLPRLAVPLLERLRGQSRNLRLDSPDLTLALEQRAQRPASDGLRAFAEDVPEVVEIAGTRPFVLLLKECAQLLGSDFQQAVCRNAKRLETGVARLHDADFGWHQHRFIEGEMNPDRRECLPSNAPARVGGDVVAFRPAGEVDVLREPIARVVAVAQAGAALERPARAR